VSAKTKKTINAWLKGLLAAAIGGSVSFIADPHSLIDEPAKALKVIAVGAIIAVFAYIKNSPFPDSDSENGSDETTPPPSDAPRAS
jgi:hypothetical protein